MANYGYNMMDYMTNYWQTSGGNFMSNWGIPVGVAFLALAIWSLVWKGAALWKAGRLNQKGWFVVLLVVNTVGILEIIYIFAIAKRQEKVNAEAVAQQ